MDYALSASDIAGIKSLLAHPKKIVITTHSSPDGDAIGSSLALYHLFARLGHSVTVITPNSYPDFLHWLPGNNSVVEYELQKEKAKTITLGADIIFCLDYNALHRMDEYGTVAGSSKAVKFIIDHHQQPDNYAKYILSVPSACATAELVFEFMEMIGVAHFLDKDIAACLYTGILTDSGSFRFPSTTAKTHRIVSALIETGIHHDEIYNRIFDSYSFDRLKLIGYALLEKLVVFPEYRTALISLTIEERKRFNHKKGDTEGLVNYGLSVEGVNFAILLIEKKDRIKISFRSKGNFSVNEFARAHFEGGGHINAAGGKSMLTLKETIDKIVGLLPKYKEISKF